MCAYQRASTTNLMLMANLANTVGSSFGGSAASVGLGLASLAYNEYNWRRNRDLNLEMWDLQNEYNKPVNQKARLKEAGLNPLFYGLDGNSAGTPQPAPTQNIVDPVQASQLAMNVKAAQANIDNVKANTKKTEEEAEKIASESALNRQLWSFNEKNNVYTLKGNKFLVDFQLPQNERLTNAQRMEAENNATSIRLTWNNIKSTNENIQASTNLMNAQFRDKMADAVEKWSTMEFRKKLVQLGVYETQSRIGLNYAQLYNIKQMTANAFRTGQLLDFEIQMNKMFGSSFRLQQLNAIKFSNDRLQFDLNFDRKNKQIGWYIDNACKVVDTGVGVVEKFIDYFNPAKKGQKMFNKNKPDNSFNTSSTSYNYYQ